MKPTKITDFKKENNIDVPTQHLTKWANHSCKVKAIPTAFLYTNLDSLIMDYGLTCSVNIDKRAVSEKLKLIQSQPTSVYIMRVMGFTDGKEYIKIGVSIDPMARVASLNKVWNMVGITLGLVKVSKPRKNLQEALAIESAIHLILREQGLQLKTLFKIEGHTEMFEYQPWMMELIDSSAP